MTQTNFIQAYHHFKVSTRAEAESELAMVGPVEGDVPVIVDFGELGFGLMLKHAAKAVGLI